VTSIKDIRYLGLVLRPNGSAKQQISRLDGSSDKNRRKKQLKNRSGTKNNEVISSRRKVWSIKRSDWS